MVQVFIIDNMTAGNAVDDGSEEPGATAASSDQGGKAPNQPDLTLADDPGAMPATPVKAPSQLLPTGEPRNGTPRRRGCPHWKLFVGSLAVGAFAGLAGCAIAGRKNA
jgi:hypothetical protein